MNRPKPKHKRYPLHGWLNLDKPEGMGSTEAVTAVKKLLSPEKIGHAGTLDPLASGILPLALGEATKTVPYAMDKEKTYRFTIQFGIQTSTDDREGEVVATSANRPTREAMLAILPRYTGLISQRPPAFSALKVNGERAYDLARAGQEVVLEAREILVHSLQLIDFSADAAVLEAVCGKGTYVRALARDIALDLGTVGHVKILRRQSVGPFTEKNAISLESLAELVHSRPQVSSREAFASGILTPLDTVLDDILAVEVEEEAAAKLKLGQAVFDFSYTASGQAGQPALNGEDVLKVTCNGRVVALGEREGRLIKPVRVFLSGFVT